MVYGRTHVNDYKITFNNNNTNFVINSVIKEKLLVNNGVLEGFFVYGLNESGLIKALLESTPLKLEIISTVRDAESGKDSTIVSTIFYPTISYIEEMDSEKDVSFTKIEFKGTTMI